MSAGIVRALNIDGGSVRFVLEVDAGKANSYQRVKEQVEGVLKGTDGIEKIQSTASEGNLLERLDDDDGPVVH